MASTQVDRITGLSSSAAIKVPVRVASTGADLSTYLQSGGLPTLDGQALAALDRVLVKDQDDQTQNGIYIASTSPWVLAQDFDNNADLCQGTLVFVAEGTENGDQLFELTSANPVTIGTSDITFAIFSAPTSGVTPGSYTLADITVNSSGMLTAASNGSIPDTAVTPGSYTNTNLTVGADGRITAAADGSASGGVASLTAGTGISVSGSTGSVTVANTGVTEITAGSSITVTGSSGSVTISSSAGAVTSVFGRTGAVTLETADWTGAMPTASGALGTYAGAYVTNESTATAGYTLGTTYTLAGFSGAWLCMSQVFSQSVAVACGPTTYNNAFLFLRVS